MECWWWWGQLFLWALIVGYQLNPIRTTHRIIFSVFFLVLCSLFSSPRPSLWFQSPKLIVRLPVLDSPWRRLASIYLYINTNWYTNPTDRSKLRLSTFSSINVCGLGGRSIVLPLFFGSSLFTNGLSVSLSLGALVCHHLIIQYPPPVCQKKNRDRRTWRGWLRASTHVAIIGERRAPIFIVLVNPRRRHRTAGTILSEGNRWEGWLELDKIMSEWSREKERQPCDSSRMIAALRPPFLIYWMSPLRSWLPPDWTSVKREPTLIVGYLTAGADGTHWLSFNFMSMETRHKARSRTSVGGDRRGGHSIDEVTRARRVFFQEADAVGTDKTRRTGDQPANRSPRRERLGTASVSGPGRRVCVCVSMSVSVPVSGWVQVSQPPTGLAEEPFDGSCPPDPSRSEKTVCHRHHERRDPLRRTGLCLRRCSPAAGPPPVIVLIGKCAHLSSPCFRFVLSSPVKSAKTQEMPPVQVFIQFQINGCFETRVTRPSTPPSSNL